MIIELEAYQAIGLLLTVVGSIWGAGKAFFARFDAALRERDDSLELSISNVAKQVQQQTNEVRQIERDFLMLKAELPEKYLTRMDFNRTFTVIDAKLDRLYALNNQQK
ncbi:MULTISPECIES: hypothetical protein [unclassified Psychrobacter]|uniref:hypothetical protein n=1 Tax=unclassified Psychrobacter TaxID=196806 RepID=UPI0010B568C3|nr:MULTISPECIES: hypothetical protein [unclassified Psychrobacter]BBI66833.1 hypothetical protein PKHYL_10240 [Psychrobacter sp. KH172YL61]